ncbi:hypothetical protein QMK17_19690 [Rhodococcus sp. G-MC3]|uniref:hypothetical protein n=1 Tax=Rhodococcus sp. G-MC3 TaxID=3046209 RepID=UPI0024B9AC36|nr:hypothetical protein [Rhodococcus sp. G-MC3]MDJ0395547.1 hypothetical protein [Rhodococcus sp. G-MC3]
MCAPPAVHFRIGDYRVEFPNIAKLLPSLYSNVLNNLAGSTKPHADLVVSLLTGIPDGVVPFFLNYISPP